MNKRFKIGFTTTVVVSMLLLNGCSRNKPATASETAAAARSVAVLNNAPSVTAVPSYNAKSVRAIPTVASNVISANDTLDVMFLR